MDTRLLQLGCHLRYSSQLPTAAVFQFVPKRDPRIVFDEESLEVSEGVDLHEYHDLHGNLCHRLVLQTGVTEVVYTVRATVPDAEDPRDPDARELAPGDLPDEALVFTMPSRFVTSDVLSGQAWKLFGQHEPGMARVEAISGWTKNYLTYVTGASHSRWTALDSFTSGIGVCRDFAHLMITMCRALNIPARYCAGYLPDMDVPPIPTPMDFHAWVEVYLEGGWWTFDPRHDRRRKGRVKVGHGRDALDVAFATTYGGPWLQYFTVTAEEIVG